jgi:hypothetical protein
VAGKIYIGLATRCFKLSIHVFGIRHHGPGCARSLRAALEELEPDIVLVEGPPDAQETIPLLRHADMKPPVALLVYSPDNPKQAVYYPFAVFSPEWQALDYALGRNIPGRFMDLPMAFRFAQDKAQEGENPIDQQAGGDGQSDTNGLQQVGTAPGTTDSEPAAEQIDEKQLHDDPLALLAQAAGYSDHELWWEREIEQRQNVTNLFESILEAMTALRGEKAPKDDEEAQREAHMRQTIRQAQKEGFQRIAVVCGAWHAPVLTEPGPAKTDNEMLKGLKRNKVEATWIPWTNSRLSYRSGYGAGVTSPGWYEHLWTTPESIAIRWTIRAAHLLRQEGLDASSASIIETVRLADALAAMRDLAMPGLVEMHEVIQTVLCNGNVEPMELIREKLELGERLGQVPAETPMVPLQRDVENFQKKLRLKASAEITQHDFDLRNETDRARSQFLHRLSLLGIPWGKLQQTGQGKKMGTFHEFWQLQWQPEFAVTLIEANIWGSTVEDAGTSFVSQTARETKDLPMLSKLLDSTILAELSGAIDQLLLAIQRLSISADVQHMMNALPPLARIVRYGNVRQTRADQLLPVIDGLFERVVINLPGACASLDDEAAGKMVDNIDQVQESVQLLNREEQRSEWVRTLQGLMDRESIHGLVRGRSCRLLLEQNELDRAELQRQTGLALSPAVQANMAAAWIEGMLRGSGLVLLHQDGLWRALDGWLSELIPETFDSLLPILRRAFSGFQAPERRKMGTKLKNLHTGTAQGTGQQGSGTSEDGLPIQHERAERVLPVLAQLMGVTI